MSAPLASPQERPQQRPRSKSTFSFRSNKSDGNNPLGAQPKVDMKDAKRTEKKSRFGKTKVDPNRALKEAEPAAFAVSEASTLGSWKGHSYKDSMGNVITDADSTNPTRPRLERPLDTIRSFEAAIESSHRRKSQMIRAESADALNTYSAGGNRRTNSYLGNGTDAPFAPNSRYSPNHLHSGQRNMSFSGHSNYGGSQYGGSHFGGSQYGGYNSGYPGMPGGYARRPMGHRVQSAPFPNHRMSSDYSMYQSPGYHGESHDTVGTGESSGSASEPWGNSTDPSSENSSIDRVHAVKQMEQEANAYGRGSPIHNTAIREEEDGRSIQGSYFYPHQPRRTSPPMQAQARPPPPVGVPAPAPEKKIIKFESSAAVAAEYAAENAAKIAGGAAGKQKPPTTKRKSWFGRKK